MRNRYFRNKHMALIIRVSLLVAFVVCSGLLLSPGVEQGVDKELSPLPTAIKQDFDTTMVPSTTKDFTSSTSFPISVEDFSKLYGCAYLTDDPSQTEALGYLSLSESLQDIRLHPMAGGWEPTEILGYAKRDLNLPYNAIEKSRLSIVSKSQDRLVVNVLEWDTERNSAYSLSRSSSKTKSYLISDDAEVWLKFANGYFRIPKSDLDTYIKTVFGRSDLWAYAIKDGKIISLIEQYVP